MLRSHQRAISESVFSPDGRELAIASADGTVRIAAIDWPLIRQRLAAATSACLTAAQRLHLLGESEDEARVGSTTCERRHGREPAAPAPPPTMPPQTAPGGAAEGTRR